MTWSNDPSAPEFADVFGPRAEAWALEMDERIKASDAARRKDEASRSAS